MAHYYTKAASETDPNNPLFTLHYAHLLYNHELIGKAKTYYLKTINYDDDMLEAHFNLAAIYTNESNKKNSH